jgi:hypothetical protein
MRVRSQGMHTSRTLVLGAFAAALTLGGCASGGSGSGVLPATATVTEGRTVQPQSFVPATLTITQNVPPAIALVGTKTIPCAAEITSSDSRANYMVIAWAPVRANTLPSGSVSIAVSDLTQTFAPLPTGYPGLVLWHGARAQPQTHCIDVTITAPAGLPNGTYAANIQYALLTQVYLGLYAMSALQSATIVATVNAPRGR